jgi:hypothetical protein
MIDYPAIKKSLLPYPARESSEVKASPGISPSEIRFAVTMVNFTG